MTVKVKSKKNSTSKVQLSGELEKDKQQTKGTPREMLSGISFCVFDLETTGGNLQSDKIIEIGMCKIENLKITAEKNFLIRPEIKIPQFVQKLTSIHQQDVEKSPLIEEVIDEILEFMGDSILVAHNTSFDVNFFNSVLTRLSRPTLTNKSICTNLMTKYLIPNLLNTNLTYMSKIFNIKHKKAHRALDDAKAAALLLIKYLEIFIDKNIQKVNSLYYPRNKYELDRINFKVKEHSNEEVLRTIKKISIPYLIVVKGENGIFQFALPCINTKNEYKFIEDELAKIQWESITVRLTGPFLDGLLAFNALFSKLENHMRNTIMQFLISEHLKGKKRSVMEKEFDKIAINNPDFGDFIIANHLVPEQYVIWPLRSLGNTPELVFRYPGHKKKLLQYISNKTAKISNNKLVDGKLHTIIKEFLAAYLLQQKESAMELFIFKKSLPVKRQQEFFLQLEEFLSKNPNPYNYPKEYI